MAYGLDLFISGTTGEITIIETHNGSGVGEKIIEMNGRIISALTAEESKELLNLITERMEKITLLLESGKVLDFLPNSTPDEKKWKPSTEELHTINPYDPVIRYGLELGKNGTLYAGKGRIRTSALVNAYFGE